MFASAWMTLLVSLLLTGLGSVASDEGYPRPTSEPEMTFKREPTLPEHTANVNDVHGKRRGRKKTGSHGSGVRWGSPFNTGSLQSSNVIRDCVLPQSQAKVCCYAVNSSTTYAEDVRAQPHERGFGFQKVVAGEKDVSAPRTGCVLSSVYHPSSFEKAQFDLAYATQNLSTISERYDALREAVNGEEMIRKSTIWLSRVKERMTSMAFSPNQNEIDSIYLSRFHLKATCDDGHVEEWDEFIEPLTVNARHPFGYEQCPKNFFDENRTKVKSLSMTNVDYVLLQSGLNLQKRRKHVSSKEKIFARNFMLDAGIHYFYSYIHLSTNLDLICLLRNVIQRIADHVFLYTAISGSSAFDSSLIWFTCGYGQQGIPFDQVYAWEYTLLEPRYYWSRVPEKWKPFWYISC